MEASYGSLEIARSIKSYYLGYKWEEEEEKEGEGEVNGGSITLIGRIPYGGFAEFYTSRVKRHVSILRAAAQQHVFELLEVALLAEAEHERPSDIRRVFHRQLEQRAGLLQLLHEPHAWRGDKHVRLQRD